MVELDEGSDVVVLIVVVVGALAVVGSTSKSFDSVAFVGSFSSKHFKFENICSLR